MAAPDVLKVKSKLFLSYSRADQDFVRQVAEFLAQDFDATRQVFYDETSLLPGDNWVNEIDKALKESNGCLVFIGKSGLGKWQSKEVLAVINTCIDAEGDYRMIPVILPGENISPQEVLPWFIADYEWVRFTRPDDPEAFARINGMLMENAMTVEAGQNNNPYKGLEYFDVKDTVFFFGRTPDLNSVFFQHLRPFSDDPHERFLAIVGNSGSGKSSFARAGVLASLKSGKYKGSNEWVQAIMKPEDDPLLKLSTTLEIQGLIADSQVFENNAMLYDNTFRRALELKQQTVVLLIDQFEEVITQCRDEARRGAFLGNLTEGLKYRNLIVLITLRVDFYAAFAGRYESFNKLLKSSNYILPEPDFSTRGEGSRKLLRDIILKPSKLCGVQIGKELVSNIIEDCKDVQGVLPVLQMALASLWEAKGVGDTIHSGHYDHLSAGRGINGIIEKHAETIYDVYTSQEEDVERVVLVKNIFLRLVEITDIKEDVRKTIKKDDLLQELAARHGGEAIETALQFFSGPASRLLRIGAVEQQAIQVEIVHEVLIRRWHRLKTWIEEKRTALRYRQLLELDLEEWKTSDRDPELLYTTKKMAAAQAWLQEHDDLASPDIRTFVQLAPRKEAIVFQRSLFRDITKWEESKNPELLYSSEKYEAARTWHKNNPDLSSGTVKDFLRQSRVKSIRDDKGCALVVLYGILGLAALYGIWELFDIDISLPEKVSAFFKSVETFFDKAGIVMGYIVAVGFGLGIVYAIYSSIFHKVNIDEELDEHKKG